MSIDLRPMVRGDILRIGSDIDRSEYIPAVYRHENGELREVRIDYHSTGWTPDRIDEIHHMLHECFDRGGWFLGAFEDGSGRLAGVAVLDPDCPANAKDVMQLKFLHVSKPHRGSGLGKTLFERAAAEARVRGARGMYVSATESVHTVQFYFRRGCRLASSTEVDPDLYALEPEDIHLICPLG